MEKIIFFKMSGSGNDFIIIDNRKGIVSSKNLSRWIEKVCRRRLSVGADGLILVESTDGADFKWRYYNADGGRAEMCGNGARCVSRFAYLNGIAGPKMSFETDAGIIHAAVVKNRVKVKIPDPSGLKLRDALTIGKETIQISRINTGVPHVVMEVADIEPVEVVALGKKIRYHKTFAPAGTNVNFVCCDPDGILKIRTYERGVEDETLACGTGASASAVIMACKSKTFSPTRVKTRSGEYLTIYFRQDKDGFSDVYLEGDARVIYKGELCEEAFDDGGKINS